MTVILIVILLTLIALGLIGKHEQTKADRAKPKHVHHYDWTNKGSVNWCGGDYAYCECGDLVANHYCMAPSTQIKCIH